MPLPKELLQFNPTRTPKIQPKDTGFSIIQTAKQLGGGFLQGLTTFDITDEPRNTSEAIAHSIGEVAGFMGVIPNPIGIGKRLAGTFSEKVLLNSAERAIAEIPMVFKMHSIPTLTADWVMKGFERATTNVKLLEAAALYKPKSAVVDILKGGLHLGIAGAVGAKPIYQMAIEDRVGAFMSMAPFGMFNRFLGINITPGGKFDVAKAMEIADPDKHKFYNAIGRAFAGGLAMGVPSTLRGDPAELQIYEYLLNAGFGYFEPSMAEKNALGIISKKQSLRREHELLDPKRMAEWGSLDVETQKELMHESDRRFGNMMDSQITFARAWKAASQSKQVQDYYTKPGRYIGEMMDDGLIGEEGAIALQVSFDVANKFNEVKNAELSKGSTEKEASIAATEAAKKYGANQMAAVDKIKADMLSRKIGEISVLKNAEAVMRVRQFSDEQHVDYAFHRPFYQMIQRIGGAQEAGAPKLNGEAMMKEFIGDFAKAIPTETNKSPKFDTFKDNVLSKYPVLAEGKKGENVDLWNKLKQNWVVTNAKRRLNKATIVLPGSDATKGEKSKGFWENVGERDRADKLAIEAEAPSPLELILDRPTVSVTTFSYVDKLTGKWDVKGIHDTYKIRDPQARELIDAETPHGIVLRFARAEDMILLSGVKDRHELVFVKRFLEDTIDQKEPGKVTYIVKNNDGSVRMGADGKPEPWSLDLGEIAKADPSFEGAFNQLQNEYIDVMTDGTKPTASYKHMLEQEFSNSFAHSVYAWEKFNGGIKMQELIKTNVADQALEDKLNMAWGLQRDDGTNTWKLPKRFLWSGYDLNQRAQLMWGSDTPINHLEMGEKIGRDSLRSMLVAVDPTDRKFNYLIDGKLSDASTDGVVALRWDIYDALMEQMGLDKSSGGSKGSIAFNTEAEGGFIGKLLFHRASEALNKVMVEKDFHQTVYTSAAKQYGNRPLNLMKIAENGDVTFENINGIASSAQPVPTPEVKPGLENTFEVPLKGLRLNPGVQEDGNKILNEDTHAVKQLFAHLDDIHRKIWKSEYMDKSTFGDPEQNRWYLELANMKDDSPENVDKVLKRLDFDKVGVQNLLNTLSSVDEASNPVWIKVVDKMLRLTNDKARDVSIEDEDSGFTAAELGEMQTDARALLAETELTPQLLRLPAIQRYVHARVGQYVADRTFYPTMKNSWSSMFYAHDPLFVRQYGHLKEGEYMAAKGLRNKVMTFGGKKTTLGEMWEEYQKSPTPELEEAMNHVVMRVPADSASGIRVLKLKGFTDAEGYGVHIHPKDMSYLGGADLDADKVFIYADMDKRIKNFYNDPANRYQWETKDGKFIEADTSSLTRKNIPPEWMKLAKNSWVGGHSPLMKTQISRFATQGRDNLGTGLSLLTQVKATLIMKGYPKEKLRAVEEMMRNVVNASADSAKKDPLIQRAELIKRIESLVPEEDLKLYKQLGDIRSAFKQKDKEGRVLPLWSWIDNLHTASRAVQHTKPKAGHAYWDAFSEIGRNIVHERPFVMFNEDAWYQYKGLLDKSIRGSAFKVDIDGQQHTKHSANQQLIMDILGLKDFKEATGDPSSNPHINYTFWSSAAKNAREIPEDIAVVRDAHGSPKLNPDGTPILTNPKIVMVKRTPEDKNNILNQLAVQDALAYSSYSISARKAINFVFQDADLKNIEKRKEQLKKVIQSVQVLKYGELERIENLWQGKAPRKKYDEILDSALKVLKNESPEIRSFAESWFLGSLHTQEKDISQIRIDQANTKQSLEGKRVKLTQDAADGKMDARTLSKRLRGIQREMNTLNEAGALKTFYRRGHAFSFWRYPFISLTSKVEMINEFNLAVNGDPAYHKSVKDMVSSIAPFTKASSNLVIADLPKKVTISAIDRPLKANLLAWRAVNDIQKAERPWMDMQERVSHMYALAEMPLQSSAKTQKELERVQSDLATILTHNPNMMQHITSLFRGITMEGKELPVGKEWSVATMEDLKGFVSYFKRGGMFWHEVKDKPQLRKWYFFHMPEMLADDMVAFDAKRIEGREAPVVTAEGIQMRPVTLFKSHMGQMVEWARLMHREEESLRSQWDDLVDTQVGSLIEHINRRNQTSDANEMFKLAVRYRELGRKDDGPTAELTYKQRFDEVEEKLKEYAKKVYLVEEDMPSGQKATVRRTGGELIEKINAQIDRIVRDGSHLIEDKQAEQEFFSQTFHLGTTEIDPARALTLLNNLTYSGKAPKLGLNGLQRLAHAMRVNNLETFLHVPDLKSKNAIYAHFESTLGLKSKDYEVAEDGRTIRLKPLFKYEPSVRQRIKESLAAYTDKNGARPMKWVVFDNVRTGLSDFMNFFPHNTHDRVQAEKYLKDKAERMQKSGKGIGDIKMAELIAISKMEKSVSDDGKLTEDLLNKLEELNSLNSDPVSGYKTPSAWLAGSQKGRARDEFGIMPGWDESPNALKKYGQQLIKTYHNMAFSTMSNKVLDKFIQSKPFGDATPQWAKFLQLYIRQNLGHPSGIPDEWMRDEKFMKAYNPYQYFTDQYWLKKFYDLDMKYFGKPVGDVPKDKLAGVIKSKLALNKIANLSNLEAKWELISLLSHTKTMFNNLIGGNLNTGVQAGFDRMFKSWNTPKILSLLDMKDADGNPSEAMLWKFVEKHGAVESFVKAQIRLNPEFQSTSWVQAFDEALANQRAGKPVDFGGIAKRHGLGERVFEKAAWFMKVTEVQNRKRAWLTGYLRAREIFDANKMSYAADDPWLIQFANRTVEATQFLYNSAARPMFAATNVGKIFTRFQLYSYNSLAFRSNINKMAAMNGYRPDSEEFKRMERMVLADMFVMALAGLFPSSMFDATLAEPWKTLQTLSEWMFGNDEQRKRAFFGTLPWPVAPLQAISPPSSRILYPVFNALLTGDWEKWATQTSWTLFPFGRLAKDTVKTLNNPAMIVENYTGIPVHRIGAKTKTASAEAPSSLSAPLRWLLGEGEEDFPPSR